MPGRATNETANYIGFAKQTAKDAEGTTFFFLKHLDGSGFEIDQQIQADREGGDGQEVGLRYKTQVTADGQMVFNVRPQVAARVLAGALGADSFASVVAGATLADHTITPTLGNQPYFTIEQRYADEIERVTNNIITSLQIEGEAGRPLKITGGWTSGGSVYQRDVASTLTATRETTRPLFFPGGSYALSGIVGAGSYAKQVTKFSLTVNNNVDDGIFTTALNREDVVALNFDTGLDMTIKYEDRVLYNAIQFNGGSQIAIPYLPTGSFNAFTQFGSYQLRINMPMLEFVDAKINKLDPDGKTMYLDVSAAGVKNATYQIFAVVRTDDQSNY